MGDWVTLGKGSECTQDGAWKSTFNHRQYGSGQIFRGCGVDTGYDGDCCNCWKFKANNAMLDGAAVLLANSSSADSSLEAAAQSASDYVPTKINSSLRGSAMARDAAAAKTTVAELVGWPER